MRKALRTLDNEAHAEKIEKQRSVAHLREKTFSQLTVEDKDVLLKLLAEQLGFIKAE